MCLLTLAQNSSVDTSTVCTPAGLVGAWRLTFLLKGSSGFSFSVSRCIHRVSILLLAIFHPRQPTKGDAKHDSGPLPARAALVVRPRGYYFTGLVYAVLAFSQQGSLNKVSMHVMPGQEQMCNERPFSVDSSVGVRGWPLSSWALKKWLTSVKWKWTVRKKSPCHGSS